MFSLFILTGSSVADGDWKELLFSGFHVQARRDIYRTGRAARTGGSV